MTVAHWIGGELPGSPDRRLEVHDPATGTVVRHVTLGDADVVDTAVRVADDAATVLG